jgi:hypothetical protein
LNYNNDNGSSPFKKGRLKDVVKFKPRHTRVLHKSDKEVIDILTVDLVQVFADVGIHLKTVYTIAKGLARLGWTRQQKIIRDEKEG